MVDSQKMHSGRLVASGGYGRVSRRSSRPVLCVLGAAIALHLTGVVGGEAFAAGGKPAKPPVAKPQEGAESARLRDDVAEFLQKPAEQAMKERKYALAISIWRGVVAIRGEGDDAMWKLAEAWTLAGEFDSAIEELERLAGATDSQLKKQKAVEEIAALKRRERGFGMGRFRTEPAVRLATEAFKRGRAAYKGKKYELATLYFRAGVVMAPDLPGNYRELGEAYDKMGKTAEANEFFVRYLQRRPFGKNSDLVRTRLAKAKLVGKLTIESALPCDEVWVQGQPLDAKMRLPIKNQVVAPGSYKLLCFSQKYHHAQFETVEVRQGQAAQVSFAWAILHNKLDPWGRVVIENPRDKNQMMDIGLWEEVGVPVPSDRRSLKIVLTAGDGSKRKEDFVKLAPGQRFVLKW
jgi:tetratricopeptide (TPR) repeat protein